MKKETAQFDLKDLLPIGMTVVVLGIGLAYGLNVMSDVQSDFVTTTANCGANATGGSGGTISYSACGTEYNATGDAITAVGKIPAKLGLIVTVVIAAVVIGILIRYLFVRFA